jgi:hypothetical protein
VRYRFRVKAKAWSGQHLPVFGGDAIIVSGLQVPGGEQVKDSCRRAVRREQAGDQIRQAQATLTKPSENRRWLVS